MNQRLFTICFLVFSNFAFAQQKTNTIRQRTDFADLVVEGRIIQTTPFWNQDHSKIYTSNLIAVSKVFKGEVEERFELYPAESGLRKAKII